MESTTTKHDDRSNGDVLQLVSATHPHASPIEIAVQSDGSSETIAAQDSTTSEVNDQLKWSTAADVDNLESEGIPWIVQDLLAPGSITEVVYLSRPEGNQDPTIRKLKILGRFGDQLTKMIALRGNQYVYLGEEQNVLYIQMKDEIQSQLVVPGAGLPLKEMVALVRGNRSTVQTCLSELENEGRVKRSGKGVKGDPYRYQMLPTGTTAPPTGVGRTEKMSTNVSE